MRSLRCGPAVAQPPVSSVPTPPLVSAVHRPRDTNGISRQRPASRVLGPNTAAGLRLPQTRPQDSGGQEIGHQARAILLASVSVSGAKKEKFYTFIVDLNLLLFVRLTSDFLISSPSTLKEENQGETRNIS